MRVAIAGKGGAGKTTITVLLARAFAVHGHRVLVVDLDTNPGVAVSLGLDDVDAGLPDDAVTEDPDATYGWDLRPGLTPAEVVSAYGRPAADNITLLSVGSIHQAQHGVRRSMTAVRRVLDSFAEPGWVVLADLEAGPATPFEGMARTASPLLVVAAPTPGSLQAARRILSIADADHTPARVVVNRAVDGDAEAVAAALGRPVLATIPHDERVAALDAEGRLLDVPPASPAAAAVMSLAARLNQHTEVRTA